MDAEKIEVNVTPKGLPGRKRVAHEAKQTEVGTVQSHSKMCVFKDRRCPFLKSKTLFLLPKQYFNTQA